MSGYTVYQAFNVNRDVRSAQKQQRPVAIWLTGLSGAGKSTIANALETRLVATGHHTYLLDGDNVRQGLCRDLGFSDQDREENIRRVAEVSKLLVDAGIIVISAFISPFSRDRRLARDVIGDSDFIEVFINTPLAECERRDPKGLYVMARQGVIRNFTGIDSVYEPPEDPDIVIDTVDVSIERSIDDILQFIAARSA